MFRTMTIVLALVALVACAACNSVTAPMSSDEQINVNRTAGGNGHDKQLSDRSELSDPGDGGGGSGDGTEPGKDFRRPRPGTENQYDDGNGSDPGRRTPNGTGGR